LISKLQLEQKLREKLLKSARDRSCKTKKTSVREEESFSRKQKMLNRRHQNFIEETKN